MRHEYEKPIDESLTRDGQPRIVMPSIESFGPINDKGGKFYDEYNISTDGEFILWYAQKMNGQTSGGPLISRNTKENQTALEQAGYKQGKWPIANIESGTTETTRAALTEWLKRTSI